MNAQIVETGTRWHEHLATFLGNTARPLTFILAAVSAMYAVMRVSHAVAVAIIAGKLGGEAAGGVLFVVLAGVGAIYIGKSLENYGLAKHKAAVETAAINAAPPANVAMDASPPSGVSITPGGEDEGVLPPDQRIMR